MFIVLIIILCGELLFSFNKFTKVSCYDKAGILLFVLSFIFFGIMVIECFKPSIWGDEAFSLFLVQKTYYDIVVVTSVDVHPPLYYFILKFVLSLFQSFNLTPNSVIIVGRFVSVVPFVLLLVLSFFKVREYWGWLCCGVFAVCLTSMPQLMYFAVEIRMYSWALFFVTVCFIYACAVIRESNVKNWIILCLSGVCAAYTHYFAAISVIIIFLSLLIYLILNNKSEIKKWIYAVILSSLLFLPWVFILLKQIMAVNENYWIGSITVNSLVNYISFIFLPSFSTSLNFSINIPFITILGFLLLESYLVVIFYFFKNKSESHDYFDLVGLFTLILTVISGIMVSILFKPIFVDRYMFPSLGVFWLTFAFLFSKMWNRKSIFVPILIIVLIVSSMSSAIFINSQITEYMEYNKLDSFLSQNFTDDDVFFIDLNEECTAHYYQIIQYPLNAYHNFNLRTDSSDDISPIFKNFNDLENDLENNKTVWLFSSEGYDFILSDCTKNNLTIKKQDSYNFELNDTCNLYKVSS